MLDIMLPRVCRGWARRTNKKPRAMPGALCRPCSSPSITRDDRSAPIEFIVQPDARDVLARCHVGIGNAASEQAGQDVGPRVGFIDAAVIEIGLKTPDERAGLPIVADLTATGESRLVQPVGKGAIRIGGDSADTAAGEEASGGV